MRPTIVRLDDLLSLRARTHADRTAIVASGQTATYAELETGARATARRLAALGVGRGHRVATTLPAGLDFARLLHAVPKLGATLVPINTRLPAGERRAQVEDAAARVMIEEPPAATEADAEPAETEAEQPLAGAGEGVEGGPPPNPPEPWTLLFTSGTTGRPTPVLLSRWNHVASALATAWALGVAPDDRWLCVLPVFHVGGLAILIRSALYGTAAVIHERFHPDRCAAALAGGEATLVSLVPTMLRRLADAGLEAAPAVRAVLLGGAPAPADLLRWAAARALPVVRTYGMTETASQVAVAGGPAGDGARRGRAGDPAARGRAGDAATPAGDPAAPAPGARPLPGVDLRISAAGEILVRGPMVARGSRAEDGWLHTRDRGRIDEHGLLHVEGRIDDVIVTGGENVWAPEVERALLSHPAVVEAAVIGAPDREWGEVVTAHVVAGGAVEAAELRAHCRGRIAAFKVPKEIFFVPELPRNAAGKVEGRDL